MFTKKTIITGVTPLEKIPKNLFLNPYSNINKTTKLCISKNRPSIKNILKFDIKLKINTCRKVLTSQGYKLEINGVKNISMIYDSHNSQKNHNKVTFKIPFKSSLALENYNPEISKLYTAVKKISIKPINSKCFLLSTNIFLAPILKKVTTKTHNCPSPKLNKNHNNYYGNSYYREQSEFNAALLLILVLIILSKFHCYNYCSYPFIYY